MDIFEINKYWTGSEEELCTYQPSQLDNSRLLKSTIDFLVNCGLPDRCAPGLSFEKCSDIVIPTPNKVLNIDIDSLNEYLMIGSNGCGDPVCIDLNNENEIVYLNHDNDFERVFINSSVHQLSKCIKRYRVFYASLNPRFEKNVFIKRKFQDEEFLNLSTDFETIDYKCLLEGNCWKSELDELLWERDNE